MDIAVFNLVFNPFCRQRVPGAAVAGDACVQKLWRSETGVKRICAAVAFAPRRRPIPRGASLPCDLCVVAARGSPPVTKCSRPDMRPAMMQAILITAARRAH
jgi:hypothetical protein